VVRHIYHAAYLRTSLMGRDLFRLGLSTWSLMTAEHGSKRCQELPVWAT
jgi:hypothetical protein